MKIVESNIEDYNSNLKSLIEELNPTYVLGGLMAIQEIKNNNLLPDYKIQHSSHYDSRELFYGIVHKNNYVPISSYNVILFTGFKIVGQIYLDQELIWKQIKENNVSN